MRAGWVSVVSGHTTATFTDLLYLDIVQQEASLVANCANSNHRQCVTCSEVIHVLLPLVRCWRYDKCTVESWELNKAELLGVEVGSSGRMNVERDAVLVSLPSLNSLCYVTMDEVSESLFILSKHLAATGGHINSSWSRPAFGKRLLCSGSESVFLKRWVLHKVLSQLEPVQRQWRRWVDDHAVWADSGRLEAGSIDCIHSGVESGPCSQRTQVLHSGVESGPYSQRTQVLHSGVESGPYSQRTQVLHSGVESGPYSQRTQVLHSGVESGPYSQRTQVLHSGVESGPCSQRTQVLHSGVVSGPYSQRTQVLHSGVESGPCSQRTQILHSGVESGPYSQRTQVLHSGVEAGPCSQRTQVLHSGIESGPYSQRTQVLHSGVESGPCSQRTQILHSGVEAGPCSQRTQVLHSGVESGPYSQRTQVLHSGVESGPVVNEHKPYTVE